MIFVFRNFVISSLFLALTVVFSFLFFSPASAALPSDHGLKEGDLISAIFSDDPDVYIVNEHGYKRLFLNPEIFKFYSHLGGFTNIKLVTPEVRDAFLTVALFRNCEKNDQKVYGFESTKEDEGKLRWVNTSGDQAVQDDPAFFKKVFCINDKEFKWYKRGEELKSVREVSQYQRGIPPIPVMPAMPAVPASVSHPITPTASGSLPLTPASVSAPVAQPATPAVPATSARPAGSTPTPTTTPVSTSTPTPTPTPTPIYSTPPIISSVLASSITSNSAVISWITDVPATGFVNYGSTPTNWIVSPANTSLTTQHSFTISNLAANTLYTFRVYSHNAYGDQTDIVNGYPPNRTFTTLSGPISCSGISLNLADNKTTYIKGTDSTINYTWTCVPGGSATVNIGIQKPTGWISLNTTANSSTQTSSINISGSDYPAGSYRLEACFGTCGSIVTGQNLTITSSVPTPTSDTTPPSPPVPSVTAISSSEIKVSWSASTDDVGVAGYKVYRNGFLIATVNAGTFSYSDTNLAPNTSYPYTVQAHDAAGNTSMITILSTRSASTFSATPTPTSVASSSLDFRPNNQSFASFYRNLGLGSSGPDVKQLQTLLVNEVGYSANLITGYFGRITREAVKRFQEKYGIKPVSGYFGNITRQALSALIPH